MSKVLSIIICILVMCVVIVFHELGHFILAKKNGIAVPEFSIGFGPKLCGFKIGETEFTIRLLLCGGACRMLGQDDDAGEDDDRSYKTKSVGKRFATVFAGPFFNFILAFIFSVIVIGIVGYDPAVITYVTHQSASEQAGLKQGDIITSFDGDSIVISRDVSAWFSFNKLDGNPVEVKYERDGEEYTTTLTPVLKKTYKVGIYYNADENPATITDLVADGPMDKAGIKAGDIIIAVNGTAINSGSELYDYYSRNPLDGNDLEIEVQRGEDKKVFTIIPNYEEEYVTGFSYNQNGRVTTSPLNVLKYSVNEVKYWICNTVKSLGKLITGQGSRKDVGGAVRIVSELENTVQQSKKDGIKMVVLNLINWCILLSANLGVLNLLPIPALDGGRLILLIIEAIRRKPLSREKEGIILIVGAIFIVLLMIFMLYNDIVNVFF